MIAGLRSSSAHIPNHGPLCVWYEGFFTSVHAVSLQYTWGAGSGGSSWLTRRKTIISYLAILRLQALKCNAMLTLIIQEKSGIALSKLFFAVLISCGSNTAFPGPEDDIHTTNVGLLFAMSDFWAPRVFYGRMEPIKKYCKGPDVRAEYRTPCSRYRNSSRSHHQHHQSR